MRPGTKTGLREEKVARLTGLEPATPGVTGRYSNQLSYNRAWRTGYPPPARAVNAFCTRPALFRPLPPGAGPATLAPLREKAFP